MSKYIDHFLRKGYNALAIHLRGHGQSHGKYIGLGALDKDDIQLWIKWITSQYHETQIILFGSSMGGATVLLYGGYYGDNISAIISDSSPTSMKLMIQRILKHKLGKLSKLLVPVFDYVLARKAGYCMNDASPISVIGNISVPLLIIHGKSDGFVPSGMASELAAKLPSSELLLVEGAEHVHSIDTAPVLYWATIDRFLGIQEEV